jgi:hypothetical protein
MLDQNMIDDLQSSNIFKALDAVDYFDAYINDVQESASFKTDAFHYTCLPSGETDCVRYLVGNSYFPGQYPQIEIHISKHDGPILCYSSGYTKVDAYIATKEIMHFLQQGGHING